MCIFAVEMRLDYKKLKNDKNYVRQFYIPQSHKVALW